jgi:hypothetical protein
LSTNRRVVLNSPPARSNTTMYKMYMIKPIKMHLWTNSMIRPSKVYVDVPRVTFTSRLSADRMTTMTAHCQKSRKVRCRLCDIFGLMSDLVMYNSQSTLSLYISQSISRNV